MPRIMTELLPGHRVIEQVAVGTLNDPEVLDLILGVQQMVNDTGITATLLDCAGLTQGTASVPVGELADRVAQLFVDPNWRQAIVRPHDPWASMTVTRWEALATNRGMTIRVFADRDGALAWLTETESSEEA
jgi:hypothetical protein